MSLIFETVFTPGLAHLSYLVGDDITGTAAVIDARRDVDIYLDLARKHRVAITHILETHIHADFISGSRELAARCPTASIYLSAENHAGYGFASRPLHNGHTILFGSVLLRVFHTPGHTPEHISFLVAEREHAHIPWGMFSGDFLFANSVGRPDLLGADQSERLAHQLYASLQKLQTLEDGMLIFPGHGKGSPCGAEIGDRMVTSLGYERRFNPALQCLSENQFLQFVLGTQPPEPTYYKRVKRENAIGPEVLGRLPVVPALEPLTFQRELERRRTRLIDTRSMLAFGGGHIPGALNIGLRPEIAIWAGWLLDPTEPLLLVLENDSDLPAVVTQLVRTGYTHFAGYLLDGMRGWYMNGLPVHELPQLPVQSLAAILNDRDRRDDLQLIDVRTKKEWAEGHIPGAIHIFLGDLPLQMEMLDRSRQVAAYCGSGYRASIAASLLLAAGFREVYNIPGSVRAWQAAGYQLDRPS